MGAYKGLDLQRYKDLSTGTFRVQQGDGTYRITKNGNDLPEPCDCAKDKDFLRNQLEALKFSLDGNNILRYGDGPVCEDGFGEDEADAVCRMMGYSAHKSYSVTENARTTDLFTMVDLVCPKGASGLNLLCTLQNPINSPRYPECEASELCTWRRSGADAYSTSTEAVRLECELPPTPAPPTTVPPPTPAPTADVCFTLTIKKKNKKKRTLETLVVKGQPGDRFKADGCSATARGGSECINNGWGKGIKEIRNQRHEVVAYARCCSERIKVVQGPEYACTRQLRR